MDILPQRAYVIPPSLQPSFVGGNLILSAWSPTTVDMSVFSETIQKTADPKYTLTADKICKFDHAIMNPSTSPTTLSYTPLPNFAYIALYPTTTLVSCKNHFFDYHHRIAKNGTFALVSLYNPAFPTEFLHVWLLHSIRMRPYSSRYTCATKKHSGHCWPKMHPHSWRNSNVCLCKHVWFDHLYNPFLCVIT